MGSLCGGSNGFKRCLANWREDGFVRSKHPAEELDRLAEDLSDLTASREKGEMRWGCGRSP